MKQTMEKCRYFVDRGDGQIERDGRGEKKRKRSVYERRRQEGRESGKVSERKRSSEKETENENSKFQIFNR